jgi:hypothetical protein
MRPRRDWEELVRAKLAGLAIEPREKREVIEELAAHLDETYEELRGRGFTEEDAAQRALREVKDWHDLRRRIQSARRKANIMNDRVRQLWLPGFLTFVLSSGILTLIQVYGPKPEVVALSLPWSTVYIPWLLLLPLVGAMGAFLSRRAGGSQRAVLTSVVFPVLPFLASIVLVLPFSMMFDRFIAHNIAPMALLTALLGWVLAPGVALLAGGLPAQFFLSRRLDSRRIAGN